MTRRAWMKINVVNELSLSHLTAAEYGAYVRLKMHFWLHGCLPADDGCLARIASADPDEWAEIRPAVKALFRGEFRKAHG
ncbi:DUF1376 domain-containing protein [Rhizobium anhuiense]|nr:DUF1376 domain-containing protein [Rhizobium anhuiense]